MIPVLYLDIDGTVREGLNDELGRFPDGVDDIRVFPVAVERMRTWKAKGGRIVGVSNQGGIALGYRTETQVRDEMAETERQCEHLFDLLRVCPHHPDVAPCECRKPGTGLLVTAVADLAAETGEIYDWWRSVMVGDRQSDRQCAEALGVTFLWADLWRA